MLIQNMLNTRPRGFKTEPKSLQEKGSLLSKVHFMLLWQAGKKTGFFLTVYFSSLVAKNVLMRL